METALLFLLAIVVLVFLASLLRAPEGYEDSTGFHLGKPKE